MTEKNVLMMDLNRCTAVQILREVAQTSSKVIRTLHAVERMKERGVSTPCLMRVLRDGEITEGPYRSCKGNWQMNVSHPVAGKYITVGVALDNKGNGNYAIVVTVIV